MKQGYSSKQCGFPWPSLMSALLGPVAVQRERWKSAEINGSRSQHFSITEETTGMTVLPSPQRSSTVYRKL